MLCLHDPLLKLRMELCIVSGVIIDSLVAACGELCEMRKDQMYICYGTDREAACELVAPAQIWSCPCQII